jgi:hypothetical protein
MTDATIVNDFDYITTYYQLETEAVQSPRAEVSKERFCWTVPLVEVLEHQLEPLPAPVQDGQAAADKDFDSPADPSGPVWAHAATRRSGRTARAQSDPHRTRSERGPCARGDRQAAV